MFFRGKKNLILRKKVFLIVEGKTELEFFKLLKNYTRSFTWEIYEGAKKFFDFGLYKKGNLKEVLFKKVFWKPSQISKYENFGNIVEIILDKDDFPKQNFENLDENIRHFKNSYFVKRWWSLEVWYSYPCFEKILLILSGKYNKCLETQKCINLKQMFYGKNRVDVDKIRWLFDSLNVNSILNLLKEYKNKCKNNLKENDVLFLILKLLERD